MRLRFILVPAILALIAACGWIAWRLSRVDAVPEPQSSDFLVGEVRDANGPVAGARVRFRGREEFTLTDEAGRFSLPMPDRIVAVSAWKEGYFVGSAPTDLPDLTIPLLKLPADNDAYRWVNPHPRMETFSCGNCHQAIFDEWRGSAHGRTGDESRFLSSLMDVAKTRPDGTAVCASCHNPAPFPDAASKFDDVKRSDNVHCDYCHKVTGPAGGEVGLTHGRYGLKVLRPAEGQVTFGPFDDASRPDNAFSPFQKDSRLCASCHEGVVFGVHAYSTYSEWQVSPAAKIGQQCQTCHMKPTGKMTNMAPGAGGAARDPMTLGNHHFFEGSHREMLQRSLRLKLDVSPTADGLRAIVEVRADDVGHRVPTGLPDRHLVLLVEAVDASGRIVEVKNGPKLPSWLAIDAGKPGHLFAKVLKDFEGRSPAPFWRASPEFTDTRLFPGKMERFEFVFPSNVKVGAKLVYRKSWDDTGWVIAACGAAPF